MLRKLFLVALGLLLLGGVPGFSYDFTVETATGTPLSSGTVETSTVTIRPTFKGVLLADDAATITMALWAWNERGPIDVSTPTFAVGNAAVTVANYLPAGWWGFALKAYNGDVILNTANSIATGGLAVGEPIASGTILRWSVTR